MAKKIISVFLAILCILGAVSTTAFAEDAATESKVNWDEFYVIAPKAETFTIEKSEAVSITAEVNIPDGVEVTYQWIKFYEKGSDERKIPDCTESTLTLTSENDYFPWNSREYGGGDATYFCRVTGVEKDANGEVISTKTVDTEKVNYIVKMTEKEKREIFLTKPFSNAFNSMILMIGMSYGVLIPVGPFIFLASYIATVISCYKYVQAH